MRINLLQIEMDGNDAGAIVRGLTEAMNGGRAAAVTAIAAGPALIDAPKVNGRGKYVRRLKSKRDVQLPQGPPAPMFASIADAVRQAVLDGPKSNVDISDWIEARGVVTTSNVVAQALFALRKKNEVYKGDQDLKWRSALKPQGR